MKRWREHLRPAAPRFLPTLFAAAAAIVLLAPETTETAAANGDTRTIRLHHAHTKESIEATYMVDGRYDPVALEKLNWFLRDWRRDEPTHMDPKLFDVVWEVYRESGSQQPVEVMSAYRSPETNSMLRHATRGVAEHSQHILGKAMDQHYVDVPMSRIRELAMRLQRGGVGFYPTAGTPFVHMDVGGVRHWPRMGYDQLARLFPDGKTVHIPSNGQPLPGYEEARVELAARGDSFDYPTAGEVKSKGFFAWLFGGGGDEEGDGEAARGGGSRAAPPPARRGGAQIAAADPVPVGSTSDGISRGRENSASFFSLFSSRPVDPAPSPAPARPAPRRAEVASLPPPDEAAQAKLAAEMQRQAQKAAADEAAQAQKAAEAARAQKASEALARAAEAPAAPTLADAAPAVPGPAERLVPLPPRRPFDSSPVPPARPPEMVAARGDRAPAPSERAALPPAITRGFGPAPVPGRALGFAAPAVPPAAPPLPVARPALVAARLDRSNFHSLTGATPTARQGARGGVGSAVAALRSAAQAGAGALAPDNGASPRGGFGARATDLSTDSFDGAAVSPQARVSTATLRRRPPAAADD